MILFSSGSENHNLSGDDLRQGLDEALGKLGLRKNVLVIPPDITRFHSRAGEITRMVYDYYGDRISDILPALGTHKPMNPDELDRMFPGIPHNIFRVHDWRKDIVHIGEVPGDFISQISDGHLSYPWPVELNRMIWEGGHDLILSVGQVVPHEVIGMANYNKNLLIGCGGPESINKSHFLGAVYGMERIMGIADNPVRQVLNYASNKFLSHLPIIYVLTVQEQMLTRGLFIGTSEDVFLAAAELSMKVNITKVDQPLQKVVVYLDPAEYRSAWLGNKSIYRTRMAIADGGELIVLAPGVKEFGEDPEIDRLIRKYGYRGTPATLAAVEQNDDLLNNLSAAAHLIHGSSEGRFRITYCPGHLTREEIEGVGFEFGDIGSMLNQIEPDSFKDGFTRSKTGEEFYFISNPATGLWNYK
ncbi:MAG: lactate racemase domain-containing protein [Bacteroidia bacterium]|nr:lactate racemase domain-containing protein [Bacteroidia bacterium]